MRVFVAIDLPEMIRAELAVLQSALPIGRLVPTQNQHLTLSFLGEQNQAAVEEAHEALLNVHAEAFDLKLVGVGSFGKRLPQVVFADVAQNPELMDLERRITRSLRHAGLEFQKQRLRPHVTLARLPKFLSPSDLDTVRIFLERHAAFRGRSFKVTRFELYQSTLRPSGAHHERLASYDLLATQESKPPEPYDP